MKFAFLAALIAFSAATSFATEVCFDREYSAEHLSKNPSQKTAKITVHLATDDSNEVGGVITLQNKNGREYIGHLSYCELVNITRPSFVAACTNNKAIADAGRYSALLAANGNKAKLTIERSISLCMDSACIDEMILKKNSADAVFNLTKVPCSR